MKLPQLPQDKANHYIYGALIYILASLLFKPSTCMIIVMNIALIKELIDKRKGTPADFSMNDFLVTIAGGFTILLAQMIP